MKCFIIGDLQGMFQLLGRNNYDSSYCLWCKYRHKEWKQHFAHHSTCCDKAKWVLSKIKNVALEQDQKNQVELNSNQYE